jgi:hypothetical protein
MQLVKTESVTAVQRAFRTQFHMGQPSRVKLCVYCAFLQGRVVGPALNLQPGGPGCPFLFELSPSTCPAWETLLVAKLPPA